MTNLFKEFKLYETKSKRLNKYRFFLKRKEDKYYDNLQKNAFSIYVQEFISKHENVKEQRERTEIKCMFYFFVYYLNSF